MSLINHIFMAYLGYSNKMRSLRIFFFIAIGLGIMATSCSNGIVVAPKNPKPKSFGIMNDIVILTDQMMWDGAIGDSIRYYFEGVFPVTPRPEPLFDLRFFTPEKLEFEEDLRELRTYIVVANLQDEESKTTQMLRKDLGEEKFKQAIEEDSFSTSIGKNKWATGQIIIYIFANSHDELFEEIRENFPAAASRVQSHDHEQLYAKTYSRGENKGLTIRVKEQYGFDFKIPSDYRVAIDDRVLDFLMLRRDLKDVNQVISFRQYPYENTAQISKEYMKKIRNEMGLERDWSNEPNSHMVINDVDLPILEYAFEKNGAYGREFRGIWELDNDFIGGPYISYIIVNEAKGKILFVDTWTMAPGKSKRDFMQQLELIVKGK